MCFLFKHSRWPPKKQDHLICIFSGYREIKIPRVATFKKICCFVYVVAILTANIAKKIAYFVCLYDCYEIVEVTI